MSNARRDEERDTMTTLTTKDRARLRDLAAKATPGEWSPADPYGHPALYADGQSIAHGDECGDLNIGDDNLAYISSVDPATVTALLDALDTAEARADRAEAAARTLGGIVEWQGRDIARIADAEHLVQDDGDADWGMIWDLAEERATRGAAAEAERDTALARIDKVRAALALYAARDHDEACDGDDYCGTDVAEEALCALDGEVEAS